MKGKSGCKRNESNLLVPECDSAGVPLALKPAPAYSDSETAVACSSAVVRISAYLKDSHTRDRATGRMQPPSSAYDVICPATGKLVENKDSC